MISFQKQYINQVKELADKMRSDTMPSLTGELFALFETTGNRLDYEAVYFKRRKFLAVFGMAAYLFRQPADIAKLEEILWQICEEECWALPAHVNRKDNVDWKYTVDLFASETAQSLAEVTAVLKAIEKDMAEWKSGNGTMDRPGTLLKQATVERVRSEIEKRVLLPFEKNRQGWECSDHNWNAVCCGSIGSAAIYLLAGKEEARLDKLLQRICHSLQYYLDGFREDGACMEGIGYFTYGMTYFTGFAEQLLRYSKGKTNLLASHKVRQIAEFQQKMYFQSGQTVSFSDGEGKAKFRMGLTCFLAEQFDTVWVPDMAFACDFETDSCYRFMGLLRDYLWTKKAMEKQLQEETTLADVQKASEKTVLTDVQEPCRAQGKKACTFRHDVLPDAQWSICESKNGVGFAIKGGDNGEPHNHNDIGSFLYTAGGEQLICDLGAGEYTADYFGAGRYGILCNSSQGHSVPVIRGEFQKAGKQYRASYFEADGNGTTRLEFAGAYGTECLNRLERVTIFSLETGTLTVRDCFEIKEPSEPLYVPLFTETLVTRGEVTLTGNKAVIQDKSAACEVKWQEAVRNLRITERIHSNHEGMPERIRLIQWDVLPMKKERAGTKKECVFSGSASFTFRCI